MKDAGLARILSGPGPLTVFAPTDLAFERLSRGAMNALVSDVPRLRELLAYHVVPVRVDSRGLYLAKELATMSGELLPIYVADGLWVDGVRVVETDIEADNGVVHVVDGVLMP